MTMAIISVGQMRSALAHHLVRDGERVVLAAQDEEGRGPQGGA